MTLRKKTSCETLLFQLIRSLLFLRAGLMVGACYSSWLQSQVGDQLPHIDVGKASHITAAGRLNGAMAFTNLEFIS